MDSLLEKTRRHPICQIVGPHGSGKSTLLLGLLKCYEEKRENVRHLFFNDQHRQIPGALFLQKNQMFFIDGIEQLAYWNRCRLLCRARRSIVTVHEPLWFIPILYRTEPQFSVFVQLVRELSPKLPGESVLRAVYDRSAGNFRNAFFELYDQWEEAGVRGLDTVAR